MAMSGFLTLTGEMQGVIEGSSKYDGHENEIEILEFQHEIDVPTSATGQVGPGQPVHKGIKLNKLIDKSTPKLAQAMDTREVLSEVVMSWYGHSSLGNRELIYRVKLFNALIINIKAWSPHMFNVDQQAYRLMEDIVISYEKIIWSWGSDNDVEYEAQAKGNES